MMRVSEKDFLILRYLTWKGRLFEHPDYRKVLGRAGTGSVIKGKGTPTIKNYLEDDGRPELTEVYRRLNTRWPSLSKDFGFRVELLTVPFCTAVEEAREALQKNWDLCCDYLKEREFKGTLLIPHLNTSISYDVKFNDAGTGFERRNILQIGDSDCVVIYFDGEMLFVSETIRLADVKTGSLAPASVENGFQNDLDFLDNQTSFIVAYLCFLRFANVSERFITPASSRQARQAKPDEWVNDSGLSIRLMTSSYFTSTVRSEGFPRKGFFRMQPHKVNGEWTHYLRWIDATYVSGYIRKAKILTEIEND